jgi:preprotein translocase subunit SecF
MLNITGHRKIWFTISIILVGAAIASLVGFGLKQSAEFTGGTLWEISAVADQPQLVDMQNMFVNNLKLTDAVVTYDADHQIFLAHFGTIDEPTHQADLSLLKSKWPSTTELSFQSISASVGASLRTNALIALALVILGISLYIAYAFRKTSRPVSSWRYGWITLLTLFHDVAIPAGLLAILGRFAHVEVDSNFIVALLVVMGFSVHDTIVVFDRIRENLSLSRGREPFEKVVNDSVNQTLARSINTSLTLILVLIALYFVGPLDLHYFILTLLVGVTTGIYSSIFIASPLLVAVSPKELKK